MNNTKQTSYLNSIKNNDLYLAIERRELWMYFAWQDIRLRYRRSVIGPFWITISMAIFIMTLGVIYSRLFKMEITEYLPYLAASFVLWGLIASTLGESTTVFIDAGGYLKDMKINPLVIIFRMLTRNLLIFMHNLIILIGIYIYFKINPGFYILIAIAGILLVLLNLLVIAIPLSFLGARYRDIPPIVQSGIQIIFFVTPITWLPKLVSNDSWLIRINPFSYYFDLVRSPLLGATPHLNSWIASTLTLIFFSSLSYFVYKTKSSRIAFWI